MDRMGASSQLARCTNILRLPEKREEGDLWSGRRPGDPELAHAELQRRSLHSEPGRCAVEAADHPLAALDGADDVPALGLFKRLDVITLDEAQLPSRRGGWAAMTGTSSVGPGRQDHGALDAVLQLADVARPVVAASALQRLGRVVSMPLHPPRELLREGGPASGCPRAVRAAAARGSGRR